MRRAGLALALGLLTGCPSLGYERSTVTLSRGQLAVAVGQLKYELGRLEVLGEQGCAAKTIPAEVCQRADAVRTLLAARLATLDAAILDPGKGVDVDGLLKALPMLSQYATTLGLRLAPLAVP